MKEIVLYHWRNYKAFKRVFPFSDFIGFETGCFYPHMLVWSDDWNKNQSLLPKSCTVTEIIDNPETFSTL